MQLDKTNYNQHCSSFRFLCVLVLLLIGVDLSAQETEQAQDSTKTTFAFGKLNMPNPNSIVAIERHEVTCPCKAW